MAKKLSNISVFSVFLFLGALWAQTNGTLSGHITNSTGQPVPNAAVTITLVDTGASQKVLTATDGAFTVVNLPPGTYRIDVDSAGFRRTATNVVLSATAPGAVNIALESGTAAEGTVHVEGTTPVVQAESGDISHSILQRTVQELPIADRNYQQLMELLPGITPPHTMAALEDPVRNRFWETNGTESTTNNRYMNGVENLEPFYGRAIQIPANESVTQMNVYTSNYPEEIGRAGGSFNNVITRTGANEFHGSLFEFYGGNWLNARNFFDPKPFPQPHQTFNQFGGTAGGPIMRDHTFFFFSYQGTLDRQGDTVIATVPTAELRAGNFSGIPGVTLYNPFTGNPTTGTGRSTF